jgi:hypothetical protein
MHVQGSRRGKHVNTSSRQCGASQACCLLPPRSRPHKLVAAGRSEAHLHIRHRPHFTHEVAEVGVQVPVCTHRVGEPGKGLQAGQGSIKRSKEENRAAVEGRKQRQGGGGPVILKPPSS